MLSHLISHSGNVIQAAHLYHFSKEKTYFSKRLVGWSHVPVLKFMDTEVNGRYQPRFYELLEVFRDLLKDRKN